MANASIPSNINVQDTIKAMVENTKAIDTIVKSVVKITDNVEAKSLIGANAKLKKIKKMVHQYMGITDEIINTLIIPQNPQGYKDLYELSGYIQEKTGEKIVNGKKEDITEVKYRNVDALLKISSIMSGLIGGMDSLMKMDIGLKSYLNFRINLKMMGKYMKIAITELMNELSAIAKDPNLTKIMSVLVSKPEVINEVLEEKEDWEKVAENSDKGSKSSYKLIETQKGEQGLLDVINGVFGILKTIIEIQIPGPNAMKIKMLKAKWAYKMAFDTIKEISDFVKTEKLSEEMQNLGLLLRGTGKDGDDGLIGTSANLYQVMETIGDLGRVGLMLKLLILQKISLPIFKNVLLYLADIVKNEEVKKLSEPATQKTIEKIIETINSIDTIITDLLKISTKLLLIGAISLTMLGFIPFIFIFIWALRGFVSQLNKLSNIKLNKLTDTLSEINNTFYDLIKTQLAIIALAILAAPTIIAMIVDLIFMLALWGFIKVLDIVLKAIDRTIDIRFNLALRELKKIIMSFILVQLALMLMALSTPYAIMAIVINMVFLLALVLFILAAKLVLMLIDKMITGKVTAGILELAGFILMLTIIAVLLTVFAQFVETATQACWQGLEFLLALIVFVVIVGVVAVIINTFSSVVGMALAGLGILIAMITLFIVIEVLMVVISKLWDTISFEGVLGMIGLTALAIPLIIAVGLLGIGALIATPFMAMNTALVITYLVVAALMVALSAMAGSIDEKGLIKSIKAVLKAIPLIVAVGMMGITAILALAFMPMNIALIGMFFPVASMLNEIANMDLDKKKLKEKISNAKSIINHIKSTFGSFEFSWRQKRKAKSALRRIKSILNPVKSIIRKLNRIAKMKIDEARIFKNLQITFDTVFKIEEFMDTLTQVPKNEDGTINVKQMISDTVEDAIQGIMAQKKLGRADRILLKVYSITSKLNKIQEIELDKEKIIDNLVTCFEAVDEIQNFIDKKNALPDNYTYKDIEALRMQNIEDTINYNIQMRNVNRSDLILSQIHNIVKTLDEIFKINIPSQTDIIDKLNELFAVIDEIERVIDERSKLTEFQQGNFIDQYIAMRDLNIESQLKDITAENMNKVVSIVVGVGEMTKALKEITDTKVTPEEAVNKTLNILTCVDSIYSEIENRYNSDNKLNNEAFESMISHITSINDAMSSLSGISDKDVANTKQNLDNYSKFLTKIDGVKLENLEKGASLFEQMAKFSMSINGNFEQLAQTINEDLITVLKELKDIMSDVPEAIEKSSANISASVGATNNNIMSSSDNVAQVRRENPNMSDIEAEKIAQQRTQQQAANHTASIGAKLDKLISMLSNGSAKVKTSIL